MLAEDSQRLRRQVRLAAEVTAHAFGEEVGVDLGAFRELAAQELEKRIVVAHPVELLIGGLL